MRVSYAHVRGERACARARMCANEPGARDKAPLIGGEDERGGERPRRHPPSHPSPPLPTSWLRVIPINLFDCAPASEAYPPDSARRVIRLAAPARPLRVPSWLGGPEPALLGPWQTEETAFDLRYGYSSPDRDLEIKRARARARVPMNQSRISRSESASKDIPF